MSRRPHFLDGEAMVASISKAIRRMLVVSTVLLLLLWGRSMTYSDALIYRSYEQTSNGKWLGRGLTLNSCFQRMFIYWEVNDDANNMFIPGTHAVPANNGVAFSSQRIPDDEEQKTSPKDVAFLGFRFRTSSARWNGSNTKGWMIVIPLGWLTLAASVSPIIGLIQTFRRRRQPRGFPVKSEVSDGSA
jgi:hypothetical protein